MRFTQNRLRNYNKPRPRQNLSDRTLHRRTTRATESDSGIPSVTKNALFLHRFLFFPTVVALVLSGPPLDCESRSGPENGQTVFTASKNWRRAVEVYQCDTGYVLTGRTKHTCTGGEWSGPVPSCDRISGTKMF